MLRTTDSWLSKHTQIRRVTKRSVSPQIHWTRVEVERYCFPIGFNHRLSSYRQHGLGTLFAVGHTQFSATVAGPPTLVCFGPSLVSITSTGLTRASHNRVHPTVTIRATSQLETTQRVWNGDTHLYPSGRSTAIDLFSQGVEPTPA